MNVDTIATIVRIAYAKKYPEKKVERKLSKNMFVSSWKKNSHGLPQNVLSKIGRRPNLSDHGPIKKLMNAGMILSKTARAINIFDAYVSNFASKSYYKSEN